MSIIEASDLAAHLGIADDIDTTALTVATDAANARIADYCGRVFDPPGEDDPTPRQFSPESAWCCLVDDIADTDDLVVKTDAGQGTFPITWNAADYILEPINGLVNGMTHPWYTIRAVRSRTFPYLRRPSVEVTASWGWATIPGPVTQAALIEGARLFRRKDSPEGVLGFNDTGVLRVSALPLDPNAAALLAPYRRPETAVLVG